MAIRYRATLRNARLNLVRDAIDDGDGPGIIVIYDGTQPAGIGGEITTQNALAIGTFAEPCAAAAADGVLTFDEITYGDALTDGTATWARFYDADDVFVADADVGVSGSGAAVILNSTGLLEGGAVTHVSAAITSGNA
jgi:hypothetical protein